MIPIYNRPGRAALYELREGIKVDSGGIMKMKLDEFAHGQEENEDRNLLRKSPLGLDRDGDFVNSWEMNFRRIGYCIQSLVINTSGDDSLIQITVPATETGVTPDMREQPYGWTGQINEYAAELAVWRAFDLLTDVEARLFLNEHRPSVCFQYFVDGASRELEAKFNGEFWLVENSI
jgi:hypothetical protein